MSIINVGRFLARHFCVEQEIAISTYITNRELRYKVILLCTHVFNTFNSSISARNG